MSAKPIGVSEHEAATARAERDYWTAWVDLLGSDTWGLVGWTGTSSATFRGARGQCANIDRNVLETWVALAGDRAPQFKEPTPCQPRS